MMGIYKITQKSTGKVYIGQSKNIFSRWSQHINAIDDLAFHAEYRKDPTDFTFEIQALTDNVNDLNRLEKLYITDLKTNDPKYGFNATKGNGHYKENKPIKMLYVSGSINRYIYSTYLKNVENKKILIIGNFKFCDTLSLYNNLTVITDDYDFECENSKIIRSGTSGDLMGEVNKMRENNEKFDLIIANPPYNIGNKITSNFIPLAKESIVLMPFSKYRGQNLYKHILDLQLVDPKAFKDALIADNLCVCELTPKEINQTFEETEMLTFNPAYKEFYELNGKLPTRWTYPMKYGIYQGDEKTTRVKAVDALKALWPAHDKNFCLTVRAVQNGTHSVENGKSFDVLWNIKKEIDWNDLPISYSKKARVTEITVGFITFPTEKECANFTKFFYANGKDGLMNKLVKGLNKKGGSIQKAIPRIDYSVDRDYEHLTYEELLEIMREELKNN